MKKINKEKIVNNPEEKYRDKGTPKKPKTLREAIQIQLGKTKNKQGKTKDETFLEAIAAKIIEDCLSNEATRRMLLRSDLLELPTIEQEIEYPPEIKQTIEIEKEYADLFRFLAEAKPNLREFYANIIKDVIINSQCEQ